MSGPDTSSQPAAKRPLPLWLSFTLSVLLGLALALISWQLGYRLGAPLW